MTATIESAQRHPVEQLAEDFVTRFRQGERPSLTEYVQQYPDVAGELAEIIEALLALEDLGTFGEESQAPIPERLGEYHIVREIGRGGMGVVYAAEQPELGRQVALKILPTAALLRPTHLERFRREARAAARLHHTNIIPIYGVGVQDGIHFYAMQYISGRSLDALLDDLRQERAAPTANTAKAAVTLLSGAGSTSSIEHYRGIARLGLQVAAALAHAHEHGVLHRDIKPANILLDDQGTAWLGDFGLAYLEGDAPLTSTGGFVGTLRYLAPERFKGDGDARSDVYSLGATLYELLTLRPMFDETDRARLLHQVAHEEPAAPRRLEKTVPRDLETVILKAIAKTPADRYDSAVQLAEDLQRFLGDRPIAARRVSPWELIRRWVRRNPLIAGLLTAVIISLAVGLGATWWEWQRAETNLAEKADALRDAQHFANEAQEHSNRAKAHGHRAHDMLTELLHELNTVSDRQPFAEVRKRLMEKALKVHEDFINAVPVDPEDRLDTAKLAFELGSLHHRLKQYKPAEKYTGQALSLVEPEASDDAGPLEFRYVKARALGQLAVFYRDQAFQQKAIDTFEKSIAIYRDLCAREPTNRLYARGLGNELHNRGVMAADRGLYDQAIRDIREGIALIEPFMAADPNDSGLKLTVARSYQTLGAEYYRQNQFDNACASGAAALKLADQLERANPRSIIVQDLVGRCADMAGRFRVGRADAIQDDNLETARQLCREAEPILRRSQTARQRLVEYNRTDPDYHNAFSDTLCAIGAAMIGLERFDDAEKTLQQAIQERSESLRLSPRNAIFTRGQAANYFFLGRAYCARGNYEKAAQLAPTFARLPLAHGDHHVWIAELYCQCAKAAKADMKLTAQDQEKTEERFRTQALDELRQAVKLGYANRDALKLSVWLRPLHGRPEFQQIVNSLAMKRTLESTEIE